MNLKINFLWWSFLTIIGLSSGISAQNCQPTPDLPNFACVNANLYRGAQPTAEGFRQLSMRGIKTVINLRNDDENARIEEKLVRSAGMNYINIPLGNWLGPKDEKIAEIIKQLNLIENQPVFVHCKRGADRTGTVIAIYRIAYDGWSAKQTQSEAERYSFGWWQFWMKDYIDDFYHDYNKDKLRGSLLTGSYC